MSPSNFEEPGGGAFWSLKIEDSDSESCSSSNSDSDSKFEFELGLEIRTRKRKLGSESGSTELETLTCSFGSTVADKDSYMGLSRMLIRDLVDSFRQSSIFITSKNQ